MFFNVACANNFPEGARQQNIQTNCTNRSQADAVKVSLYAEIFSADNFCDAIENFLLSFIFRGSRVDCDGNFLFRFNIIVNGEFFQNV